MNNKKQNLLNIKLDIKGMHCASCSSLINKKLNKNEFIKKANVNLSTEKANITFENQIKVDDIIKIIQNLGYEASIENKSKNKEDEIKNYWTYFMISFAFAFPVFILGMFFMNNPVPYQNWMMFLLSTPIQTFIAWPMYKSAFLALKNKTANMDSLIVMGTSAAYLYSVYAMFLGDGHIYFETSAVLITVVVLGRWLEARAKSRTNQAIQNLIKLKPKEAIVKRKGKEIIINVEEVIKGDFILVKPGANIPVDGIITKGSTFVDESMITGESMPIEKKKGDEVIGGTINKHGSFWFKATKIGKDTTLSKIIKLIEDAQGNKAPIQRFADIVSSYFVPIVLVISLITFITWISVGFELSFALMNTVAVLVIACPCALGLATPTAIMVGTGKGAKNGILIKGGEALEIAHKINFVVFDKTGTITKGKPEVTNIVGIKRNKEDILKIAASIEKESEHPLAEAIVKKAGKIKLFNIKHFKAIPGYGVSAKIGNKEYLLGNQRLMNKEKIKIIKKLDEFEELGKTAMILAENNQMIGVIAVTDPIKETSKQAINILKKLNIVPCMITGDNKKTASVIASQVGIKKFFSEVTPEDKAKYVMKLQKHGTVAMVGDGINDAPALAQADIGIAMGSGTDVAMETGDIVLMKDDILDVAKSIKLSKMTMKKIKQNMFWALIYNIMGIPIAAGLIYPFTGMLLNPMVAGIAMALSSVSVVSNSLLLKSRKL